MIRRETIIITRKRAKKIPNYIAELHKVTYTVPTGRLVCDCCYSAQGQPHTRFCHWNPIHTERDNAAMKSESRAKNRRGR